MSKIYSQAAMVLRQIIKKRKSLKSACFSLPFNARPIFALVQKVLPHTKRLLTQLRTLKLPNPYLACLMLYDHLTSGKISGGGALKKIIQSTFAPRTLSLPSATQPKIWVRPNFFNPPPSEANLGEPDDLIPNLYRSERSSYINKLIQESKLIAQSKASCMPVSCLRFQIGDYNSADLCAAPGNKTLQLAELMKRFSSGKVFAFEKDEKRFKLLQKRVEDYKADNVSAFNLDFFEAFELKNVKIAVVDPSCSGSGIVEHQIADYGKLIYDTEFSDDRIRRLSRFQAKMLRKALDIPGVEQIVYSTCSIYKRENESVVSKVIKDYWRRFRIENVLKKWKVRGIGKLGQRMVRSIPDYQGSQGFFVAKIVRRKLRLKHKLHKRTYRYWDRMMTPVYT